MTGGQTSRPIDWSPIKIPKARDVYKKKTSKSPNSKDVYKKSPGERGASVIHSITFLSPSVFGINTSSDDPHKTFSDHIKGSQINTKGSQISTKHFEKLKYGKPRLGESMLT